MEKVLKGGSASMWLRNAQLAFFGALTALVGILTKDGGKVMEGGLTQGFTWAVIVMFLTVAGGGLLAACVLKYADNILRQFSTALSLLLTSTWSAALFDESVIDSMFFIGAGLTVLATFMYNGLLDKYLPGCIVNPT
jgi:UDP-galactose transporter